jgi:hypothetical protein
MWASPSKIPINTSFTSSGIFFEVLSVGDKRFIPFIERIANNTRLYIKNSIGDISIGGMLNS